MAEPDDTAAPSAAPAPDAPPAERSIDASTEASTEPSGRPPVDRRLLLVLLAIAALLLLIVVVAVAIAFGRRVAPGTVVEDEPGRADAGGGRVVQLTAVGDAAAARVAPNRLCQLQAVGEATAPDIEVLDCQLHPLAVAEASRCTPPGRPSTTVGADTPRACAPADPAVATQLLGWRVVRNGAERTVSVLVGRAPSEPDAVPDVVPRVVEATLVERYRAVDRGGRWSELAVCPADVDADGLLDLVVLARPADGSNPTGAADDRPSAVPEAVVFFPRPDASGRIGGSLRSYQLDRPSPRDGGRGCASPLVTDLAYRGDELTVLSGGRAAARR